MSKTETDMHLFEPAIYNAGSENWHESFMNACDSIDQLKIDDSSVVSILSFGYACGDRTLFTQIKRKPWLSTIDDKGGISLNKIPDHDFYYSDVDSISNNLIELLEKELEKICSNFQKIYLLQTGGLDSRIAGCILNKLSLQNRLPAKPVCVTWGVKDCRDVYYGKVSADLLGFDWEYIPLTKEQLFENIDLAANHLGSLVSPINLHAMNWFKNVSNDTVVIAASYGDSVGRGEYSGNHLLQLSPIKPNNKMGLVKSEVYNKAKAGIEHDLNMLRLRNPGMPEYVYCEYEMQGYYMRNMLAHAMSIIGKYCSIYQAFTDPEVYSYMWSIHPSKRDDLIYASILEKLNPSLARLPWARTNKALRGKTHHRKFAIKKDFHNYWNWISNDIYEKYNI